MYPQCCSFYHIRHLWSIRCDLDLDSAKLLATALASSRLIYCNALLYGIVDSDLTKLQHVQNRLARVVTKSPLFTRSTPMLCSLHWLQVNSGIMFKIILLTWKILNEKQSVYLHSRLTPSLPPLPSLRSSKGIRLSVPRVKTMPGARAVHSCALSPWNNLPPSVRSAISVVTFNKYMKTF